MRDWFWTSALLVWTAAPALGEITPSAAAADPRVQVVPFDPRRVIVLHVAQGFVLTLELTPDERIESIAVGNSAAWQVTPNKDADHLFIKPLPNAVTTNLTVITGIRSYGFELQPLYAPDPSMPYIVKMTDPTAGVPPASLQQADVPVSTIYRFSGSRTLRPSKMRDDGRSTYIDWGPKASIGAIYVMNTQGHEALVNGGLRDGEYVVDEIADEFIFRLGREEARATRHLVRKRRN